MPNGVFNLKQQQRGLQQSAWTGQKTPAVNYLVVAGGGSGGFEGPTNVGAGGGGAGGLLQGNIAVASGSAITVTVGGGGTALSNGTTSGNSGSASVFGSISATGGGGGGSSGSTGTNATSGGSGGGGVNEQVDGTSYPNGTPGNGIVGQGNLGGAGYGNGSASLFGMGGGGGGAGTVGLTGLSTVAGNGGAGIASDISGTRTTYAGGGGGSANSGNTAGSGGAGGGGAGGSAANGTAGTANTGGGGGAAGRGAPGTSGAGGSGIVIISYPDTYAAATSTTGSPTVSTSGSGSLSFNGSSQTISTAASSLLALGSGDFTIEYWVKINGSGSFSRTFLITGSASVSIESNTYTSATTPYYLNYAGTQTAVTTGSSFDVTQWHHVAIVRSGTTNKVYLNGVQAMSATDATNYSSNGTLYIGSNNSANWLNGNVTNFRIVKGTAVYTTAFTPPTAPLTAISGTSILTSAISGAYLADSSGNALTFTNTGSTVWNSASPFSTGLGYKNRVYTWTSSGSITF